MNVKRKQVDIDPKTALAISAALNDLRALTTKHDGRALAIVMLDHVGTLYGHLKMLGFETEASIEELFNSARDRAKASTAKPQVVLSTQGADGRVTATSTAPGSERPS